MDALDNAIFFLGDVQCFSIEERQDVRAELGEAIYETYRTPEGSWKFPLTQKLWLELESCKQEGQWNKDTFRRAEDWLVQQMATKYLFSTFLNSCAAGALYRGRSGGKGDLPQVAYQLFRERAGGSFWKFKCEKQGVQVFVEEADGYLSWKETITANLDAKTCATYLATPRGMLGNMSGIKSLEIIEQMGSKTYVLHAKLKEWFKKYDWVGLRSGQKMSDGAYVLLYTSIDYPTVKNCKRQTFGGGYLVEPIDSSSCKISVITKTKASGFFKKILELRMNGQGLLSQMDNIQHMIKTGVQVQTDLL
eukprot:TRINITY_DN5366_c1_g1_i1.p1 TRINITY_DN5366_c1_g1~~TRINITY_DN5366_c1_g1_i1.p1  ORF type:complete len:306 (+),score=77.90 TRINITY_DN5366_c1_g1_i1:59-976(+)